MRKVYTLLILFLLSGYSLFSQASGQSLPVTAFVQGAKAFSSGEWTSSIFLLRKAVSYPENFNPENALFLLTNPNFRLIIRTRSPKYRLTIGKRPLGRWHFRAVGELWFYQ